MEERISMKNDEERYKELQKQIIQKIRLAKEDWIKPMSRDRSSGEKT